MIKIFWCSINTVLVGSSVLVYGFFLLLGNSICKWRLHLSFSCGLFEVIVLTFCVCVCADMTVHHVFTKNTRNPVLRVIWCCCSCHFSGVFNFTIGVKAKWFGGFESPLPHDVSLVPTLVFAIPIMFFLLLHGHPSLLFPALFSTRRIICGSVTLFGSVHALTVELCFFCQLVRVYNTAFILTGALRVSPILLFSRSKDSVEDDSWVVHHGRDKKDILPFQTCLWRK